MFVCPECGLPQPMDGHCPSDGKPLAPIGEDVLLGTMIGAYRVAHLLGIGGMGRVYKGVHPAIGSRVAIKVLSRECTDRPDLVDRFFQEARAVNLIRHESIVNVLDLSRLPDGRPYIIMEYLDGAPLSAIVEDSVARGTPLALGGLARLVVEVLDALHAAHAKGVVHRDLKPDNIFVAPSGRAKVLDFGIAKLNADLGGGSTRTGSLLGTPHYMSPEQAEGKPVDHRADIYAIGVILFECITGRKPFVAESLFELLRQHVESPPPSPRMYRPDLPPALENVILCALSKAPEQRFATAQAMSLALQQATSQLAADQWTPITSGIHRAHAGNGGWQPTPPAMWGSRASQPVFEGDRAPRAAPRPSEQPIGQFDPRDPRDPRARFAQLANQSTVSSSSGQVQKQPPANKSRRGLWLAIVGLLVVGGISTIVAVTAGGEGDTQVAGADPAGDPPPTDPGSAGSGSATATSPSGSAAPAGDPATTSSQKPPSNSDATPSVDDAMVEAQNAVHDATQRARKRIDRAKPRVEKDPDDDDGLVKEITSLEPGTDLGGSKPAGVFVQDRSLSFPGWNPRHVNIGKFIQFAVAQAKKAVPDAKLTRVGVTGVTPDGFADLSLPTLASSHGDIDIRFLSPGAAKPDPNTPVGLPVKRLCEFRIMGSMDGVEISPMFKTNCKTKTVPVPRCGYVQLWKAARAQGAPAKAVANISYYRASMHPTPKWFFDIGFGMDVAFSKMWSGPGCP